MSFSPTQPHTSEAARQSKSPKCATGAYFRSISDPGLPFMTETKSIIKATGVKPPSDYL
jgi:hypothetical protein